MKNLLFFAAILFSPFVINAQTTCGMFSEEDVSILDLNCDADNIKFSTSIPLLINSNFDIFINESQITDIALSGVDTTNIYVTNSLNSAPTPFELIQWEVNGNLLSGDFNSIEDLSGLMNVLDPIGNWTQNEFAVLSDPNASNTYGSMLIRNIPTGIIYELSVDLLFQERFEFELPTANNYRFEVLDTNENCSDIFNIDSGCTTTSTSEEIIIDKHFSYNIFPNPLEQESLEIQYFLAKPSFLEIKLYNVCGRLEDIILHNRKQEIGENKITYNKNLASGIYFLEFKFNEGTITNKIIKK